MNKRLTLPDIKELLPHLMHVESTIEVKNEKITKRIKDWLNDYRLDISRNLKKSKDEKFFIYVTHLLARTSNEKWFSKISSYFSSIGSIDSINKRNINESKFKEMGYRFPNAATSVVFRAKDVFINNYESDWKSYFNKANENYESDFLEDHFLKIKYVKHKVRDLALSIFSENFIAVDSHVIDVLRRTGLICYSYVYGLELSTDNVKNYLPIRNLCLKLSEEARISLGELDRIFWHFGKSICSGKPKCNICPIQETCLYFQSK
ncbi:MAG: hypothetical protein J7K62_04245 [Thermoplasmata archaeon]|nr:hypothetical protein [Thermoplasmata archaeon]